MENDKNIIQSRILTNARYDYNVHEKRVLYRIMEAAQNELKGIRLSGRINVDTTLFGDKEIRFALNSFTPNGEEPQYAEIKKALKSLFDKSIYIEREDGSWKYIHYIDSVELDKGRENYKLKVNKDIWQAFLDFSKGYGTYFLNTAMSFSSTYSMRFYELLHNNIKPITYEVGWIREWLQLGSKYQKFDHFRAKIIDSPIAEINEKSDIVVTYSFVTEKVGKGRPKVTGVTFTTTRKNTDEVDEIKKTTKNARGLVDNRVLEYLKNTYLFSDAELKNNTSLLRAKCMEYGWENVIDKLAEIKENARNARNPKGYVIGVLKKI